MVLHKDRVMTLHGVAIVGNQQKPISMHIDTGCETTCIPEDTARRLGLQFRRKAQGHYAVLADGSKRPMNWEAILHMRLGPSYACTLKVDISTGTLAPHDMLLGMDWMTTTNPKFNFRPLSVRVTDKRGRTWELMGMRPPGAPHFCPNHGYACRDRGGGRSYGLPAGMRTGGGDGYRHGYSQHLPFRGYDQGIPVFKMGTIDQDGSAYNCGKADDAEKKWVDWRDLFPERNWYAPSNQKSGVGVTATEKLKLLQDVAVKQEKVSESKLKESLGPRTIPNNKGTMPLVEKKKQKPDNYDLFH